MKAVAPFLTALCALLLAACGGHGPTVPTGASADPPGAPRRVVSLNPCVDSILRHVADPGQIAAISHYSHDPRATSVPPEWAARFRAVGGTAEEVIALRPDLVLAGPHVALPTLAALERMGIALVKLPVPQSVTESRAQVEAVGRLLGRPDRGLALSRRIGAAVAAARHPGPRVPALIWQGGGLSPGAGTLADELLRLSGHANAAAAGGRAWGVVGLERLAADPPALLYAGDGRGEGDRMLDHPVIARLGERIAVVPYPSRLLFCGGPTIVDSLATLSAGRRRIAGGSG